MGLPEFRFPEDTLAFQNETLWSYARDPETGKQVHRQREPKPDYTLRCFVMTRAVRQFHFHAEFDPSAPADGEYEIGKRIRWVLARSPRAFCGANKRVIFRGFRDLHDLSRRYERVIKGLAGSAWRSYLQRGHWRMVFPFMRSSQEREVLLILRSVRANLAPVVHILTFPALTINHAIIPFSADETAEEIVFRSYDPNSPGVSVDLIFDRARRRFVLPPTAYFVGGDINAYQVYTGLTR